MKNNMNIPIKPLCLRKHAAAITIETAINAAATQNRLSFSDLEDILYRYYVEAQRGAEKERNAAESAYNQQVEEYLKRKAEEGKEVDDNGRNAGDPDCQADA